MKPFSGLSIPQQNTPFVKRRYSVTTDIVGFRRCGRQYGAFRVHRYAPAYQTQLYFGIILHQVLDRCHSHYHGLVDVSTKGTIPDNGKILDDAEISDYFDQVTISQRRKQNLPPTPSTLVRYFLEVENGLKSRGIRGCHTECCVTAHSRKARKPVLDCV